jgi:hypothetical protein
MQHILSYPLGSYSTQFHVILNYTLNSITPCYSMSFSAIPCYTSHAIPERLFLGKLSQADPYGSILFQAIPCYSIPYILCYFWDSYSTQLHVIPSYTLESMIPCYSMIFSAIPCYTSHAIPGKAIPGKALER